MPDRVDRLREAAQARHDSTISLRFRTRFDSQGRADWLTVKRLTAWLTSVGYSGRTVHVARVHLRQPAPLRDRPSPRLLAEIGEPRTHRRSDTPVHGRDENPLTPAVGHVVDELGFDAGAIAGFPAEEQLFVR